PGGGGGAPGGLAPGPTPPAGGGRTRGRPGGTTGPAGRRRPRSFARTSSPIHCRALTVSSHATHRVRGMSAHSPALLCRYGPALLVLALVAFLIVLAGAPASATTYATATAEHATGRSEERRVGRASSARR